MYDNKPKETTIVVDDLKYEIVKYDDYGIAKLVNCYKSDAVINIPDSVIYNDVEYHVTSIKEGSFQEKPIKKIIVGRYVRSLEKKCFWDCRILKEVVLPERIEELGECCFWGCRSLNIINIPSKISRIGSRCFNLCDSLETIILPSSLTQISSYAFCGCKSLKSINIPEKVKKLDRGCFYECDSLTEVKIPVNVEEVDSIAFYGCKDLRIVTIMNEGIKLREDCFSVCPSLMEIVFPMKKMKIDDICVDLCPKLSEQTRNHVRKTKEGKRRASERIPKSKIKRAWTIAWQNTALIILFLLAVPFVLIGFFVFGFLVELLPVIGGIYLVGLIIIFLLGLLVEIDHKFDWKYNCACILLGVIIVGLIYILSK